MKNEIRTFFRKKNLRLKKTITEINFGFSTEERGSPAAQTFSNESFKDLSKFFFLLVKLQIAEVFFISLQNV